MRYIMSHVGDPKAAEEAMKKLEKALGHLRDAMPQIEHRLAAVARKVIGYVRVNCCRLLAKLSLEIRKDPHRAIAYWEEAAALERGSAK